MAVQASSLIAFLPCSQLRSFASLMPSLLAISFWVMPSDFLALIISFEVINISVYKND